LAKRYAIEIDSLPGHWLHDANHTGILRHKGCVGFQSYNFRVEFRRVWIKKL